MYHGPTEVVRRRVVEHRLGLGIHPQREDGLDDHVREGLRIWHTKIRCRHDLPGPENIDEQSSAAGESGKPISHPLGLAIATLRKVTLVQCDVLRKYFPVRRRITQG